MLDPVKERQRQKKKPYLESEGGAVVRALASHQCGLGSNPGFDATFGLSLLLVLSLALRGFSWGTPVFPSTQKPTFPNSSLTTSKVDEEPLSGCAISVIIIIIFITAPFINMQTLKLKSCLRNCVFQCRQS